MIVRLLTIPLLGYLLLLCVGCFAADWILFQPPRASYGDSEEVIKIPAGDGVTISAIHLPNEQAQFTLLCSHGNAEDLGYYRDTLEAFRDHGFAVFAYDYPGYGTSTGTASEQSCYAAADAAYGYLTEELGVPPERILVHGRSLGGALAIYVASKHPVAGLVAESSFVSVFRVITRVPLLPFDIFASIDRIGQVQCPVLVLHGTRDEVVGFWHGQELFQAAGEPKRCLWVEGGHHNTLMEDAGPAYWAAMDDLATLIPAAP